jgi:integrase
MGENTHKASAEPIDRDAVLRILSAAKEAGAERDRLMILIGYNYAARISETCMLRTTNFDVANGIITPPRLKGRKKKVDGIRPKGRKEKHTLHKLTDIGGPLDDRQALTDWIAKCEPGALLFPICRQYAFKRFRHWATVAGVPAMYHRYHNLRHGRAMSLVDKIPLYELRDFLSHENIAVTSLYLNSSQSKIWSSVEAADRAALCR